MTLKINQVLFFGTLLIFFSCKTVEIEEIKDNTNTQNLTDNPPPNPFLNFSKPNFPFDTCYSPTSIQCIHKDIFSLRCANPGCHDGHFEPDFRTVESTYNTLVYHPIIKNNATKSFTFRVIPFDTAQSVLHERITNCCFVNTNDRMPQDNIGVPLPPDDIERIEQWILSGAKDMYGNTNFYPNKEPYIFPFYIATDVATYTTVYSNDTNRLDLIPYNPFFLPTATNIALFFLVEDDSTALADIPVKNLKLSLIRDDFSSPVSTIPATYFHNVVTGDEFFIAFLNTATLPQNQQIYMRFYTNDGDHTNDTYFPTLHIIKEYKSYWSFIIQ